VLRLGVISVALIALIVVAGACSGGGSSSKTLAARRAEQAGATTTSAVVAGVGPDQTPGGGSSIPPATSSGEPPTPAPTPPPQVTDAPPPVQQTASGAASGLQASPHCGPAGTRTAAADLSWSPAAEPGSAQKVELSTVQNGFDTGNFQSSPQLSPADASYTWPSVNPNGIHTWRVETLHGSGWLPSATDQFTGPVCVGDMASAGG
jgi:type IV secretory pathway VirB10-like protein